MRFARGLVLVAVASAIFAGCTPASGAPATTVQRSQPVGAPSPAGTDGPAPSQPAVAATAATTACDKTGKLPATDFNSGTASLASADGKIAATLSLTANGTFHPSYHPSCPAGAQAEWTAASDQWHLTVLSNTGPNDAFGGQWATLWIEHYAGEPPLHAGGTPCTIAITEVSPSGLVGRAECRGMRWLNEYEAEADPDNASPLPDYAPFDVSILFEARP